MAATVHTPPLAAAPLGSMETLQPGSAHVSWPLERTGHLPKVSMKAAPRRPGVGTVPIPGAEALRAGARPGTLSPRSGRHNTTPRPETSEFTASQFGAFRRCAIWAEMLDCYLRILAPPLRWSLFLGLQIRPRCGSGKNRSVSASGTSAKREG